MKVIHAIFENGVFRPTEPVDLPDGSEVTIAPHLVPDPTSKTQDPNHWERVHDLLSTRIETGETDMAARHDEPLP
jgi:predicted DNA-binding antitoxin AbrB/MazE fold protein